MAYRCELCGEVSQDAKECCGVQMKDLSSAGCMACAGCGHH